MRPSRPCVYAIAVFLAQLLIAHFAIAQTPTIGHLSPTGKTSETLITGNVGDKVTIIGTGFGASQGKSVVNFGAASATVVNWADTAIDAIVPDVPVGSAAVVVSVGGNDSSPSPFTVKLSIGKTSAWTANPTAVIQGKTSDVILTAPASSCGTGAGQLNDASLDEKTTKPNVYVQAGFNVTAAALNHTGSCELTVSLVAANDAKAGSLRLTITEAGATTAAVQNLGYSTVTVTSSQAAPIPDGLAPQVDIDWSVLGFQQVYDNFGKRVANNYYAVQITIGNNTGFPLQLSGAAFKINSEDAPTPTANKTIVQGSLLYGQDYSVRNIVYRSLVWAALIAAGANPYFHSANAKANYSAGVALFSSAVVNGFLQQFPDNTVKQLARLGSSDVMSDQNIIPNNSQVPYIAFVSRDSVCPPGRSNPKACGSVKHYVKQVFYDPDQVKTILGEITIVGKLLPAFSARIRVTATPTGTPPSTGAADGSVIEGTTTTIALQSTGLTGAVVSSAPAGVTANATGQPTDSSFPVSILTSTKSTNPIPIVLKRKDGSLVTFPVTVQQPVLTVSLPEGLTALPVGKATQVTIGWKAEGPDLTKATVAMVAADGTITPVVGKQTATSITATVTPAKAGSLPISLTVPVDGTSLTDLPAVTVTAK
jgi:IPT/TIG domain